MRSVHLLLIDDHAMFRAGLAQLIHLAMPHAQVAQAASVNEALARAARADTAELGVVLLDVKLQGASGLEGIAAVKQRWPQAAVIMLSSQDSAQTQRLALERGAAAFVSKAETAERIVQVINQQVIRSTQPASATTPAVGPGAAAQHKTLTPRQREVLALLGEGLPNKLIARRLDLSPNTVRRHIQDMFELFEVDSRAEALIAARHHGLVD